MSTMKAVQISAANGPFEIVERDIPEPQAREIRIKVEACGVCHSDNFVKTGGFPGITLPRVPGHEIAGRVDKVGDGVTAWTVGDRVGVGWHGGHCSECEACRRGSFINCTNLKITGITHDGGYAEYVVVPTESAARIPGDLAASDAGPLLCAGITTFNALRNSGARPGATVAVLGLGGLGHLAVQYAVRMGYRTVGVSRGADKEKLARELGAHEYVDTTSAPAGEQLQALGGADLVLATAPSSEAIAGTFDGLKGRGKLLIVAAPFDPMPVAPMAMLSGKQIAGWPSGSAVDSEDTMDFSALFGVRPRTEVFPLAEVDEAFRRMLSNEVRFRAVLTP